MLDMSPAAIAKRIVENEDLAFRAIGYNLMVAAERAVTINWEAAMDLGIHTEVEAEYLRLKKEA